MPNNIAVYPGSFDPLTFGHIDIANRALKIFDKIVVTLAINTKKNHKFNLEQRLNFLNNYFKDYKNVIVDSFDGLLIDYLKEKNYNNVIRGLRVLSDFEYEFQMAITNKQLYEKYEVIFLMSDIKWANLSSSLVKELIELNGDISNFVPKNVNDEILRIREVKK
jgi:pantetheine-phosphate adenylyltransferase